MDFLKKGNKMRVFTVLALVSFFICSMVIAQEDSLDTKFYINVYYFRGNFRCSNCYKIEEYTKEAVVKYFQDKLDLGAIVYKVINIDKKDNAHFVEDYGLYTKSVVLSKIRNNKEVEYKNLEKVWEYLDDEGKFLNYIKEEVEKFIADNKGEGL